MKYRGLRLIVPFAGLVACLIGATAHGQAPGQMPAQGIYYQGAEYAAAKAAAERTNFENAPAPSPMGDAAIGGDVLNYSGDATGCGCGDACAGGCGGECGGECGCGACGMGLGLVGLAGRSGQFFAGGEYLQVRTNFSEALAFLEEDASTLTRTYHQHNFEYADSFRFYGGYRTCDCCGEIRFTFTRLQGEGNLFGEPGNAFTTLTAPFEIVAIGQPGPNQDSITSNVNVDATTYDIDFARTMPLGSPLGDCGCCWCPAWDIKWFGGVRFADVEWARVAQSNLLVGDDRRAVTSMDFRGFGPRVGAQGRRYIGRNGNFSVFAKGALSLLVGDVNNEVVRSIEGNPIATTFHRASFTRIIPVTEIELGSSLHLRDNITITGGYLMSAFHDLGMGPEYKFAGNATLINSFDDANILSFDGWFFRAEMTY